MSNIVVLQLHIPRPDIEMILKIEMFINEDRTNMHMQI